MGRTVRGTPVNLKWTPGNKNVCLPKKADPGVPKDYTPPTLLNADYELLTHIIA
jgi:hypothetical protein